MKKKIITILVVILMIFGTALTPSHNISAVVREIIPQEAIDYAKQYYTDYSTEGKSLFSNNSLECEGEENLQLGKPFIIIDTESDTQDEIYYFPIRDEKNRTVTIMSVMGTTDGWRCCFSEEWVECINNQDEVYYLIDNTIYGNQDIIQGKVKKWPLKNSKTRIMKSIKNHIIPKFVKPDAKSIVITEKTTGKYSPKFSNSGENRTICELYNKCGQGKYGLCWAATAGTICNYRNGTKLSAIQIADKMGIGYNDGATADDTQRAMKKYNVDYIHNEKRVTSFDTVRWNINQKYPLAILARTRADDAGHFVTVYGYQRVITSKKEYIDIWNSGTSRSVQIEYKGKSTFFTYNNKSFIWKYSIYKK